MYAIARVRHFYGHAKKITILDDDQGTIATFATVGEAGKATEEMEKGNYYLAHNESGRPDYYVISLQTAEYINTGRNYDLTNYDFEGVECETGCGECEKCIAAMTAQDVELLEQSAYSTRDAE